jgi:hypothetical protein
MPSCRAKRGAPGVSAPASPTAARAANSDQCDERILNRRTAPVIARETLQAALPRPQSSASPARPAHAATGENMSRAATEPLGAEPDPLHQERRPPDCTCKRALRRERALSGRACGRRAAGYLLFLWHLQSGEARRDGRGDGASHDRGRLFRPTAVVGRVIASRPRELCPPRGFLPGKTEGAPVRPCRSPSSSEGMPAMLGR